MHSVPVPGPERRFKKGSGLSGLEGSNSPFRSGIPEITSYLDSPYPKPYLHISWYPRVFSGGYAETNRFPAGTTTPTRAEILFGSVNRPTNTRGYQEMCGVGFGVRGIRI